MSSSLDKLKALTSKLDDRLAQKRGEPLPSISLRQVISDRTEPVKSESMEVENAINIINASQEKRVSKEKKKKIINIFDQEDSDESQKEIEDEKDENEEVERSKEESDITVFIKAEEAEDIRTKNIQRVVTLYQELKIYEKSPDFENIFIYKAMNLSGIGIKEDDFGIIRKGKYIQIIAITYEPDASGKKKAKNISLGYFGKGETIDPQLKNNIIEFVLCWRYEKAFQNVEHYKNLLARVEKQLKEETISL